MQWLLFGIRPIKDASFELKISNQYFFQDMQSFFEFLVSVINHYHINGLHLFWDSFEWFCLQISWDAKYFPLLSEAWWSMINSCYSIQFSTEGTTPRNECPGYDTKPTDSEVPVKLELWRMRSNPSLRRLPGPLWSGVVVQWLICHKTPKTNQL